MSSIVTDDSPIVAPSAYTDGASPTKRGTRFVHVAIGSRRAWLSIAEF